MKYFLTLLFILICTPLWAAENKQTYFCLSSSDNSEKLLVLADVDGEQVGYLDTDEYTLNEENGVLVGPSTAGSSFFKLASGKLDLMSSAGMWSGVCHQFTNENAQALSNASKSGEVVVSDSSTKSTASNESGGSCYDNVKVCTEKELRNAATFKEQNGKNHLHSSTSSLERVIIGTSQNVPILLSAYDIMVRPVRKFSDIFHVTIL